MLVTTRFRVPDDRAEHFRHDVEDVRALVASRSGCLVAEVGRNVDDPSLWVLHTRWQDVGSYRRALGSAEVRMQAMGVLALAVDEPSAYEVVEPGADINDPRSRSLP